jgi:hypothetical protein
MTTTELYKTGAVEKLASRRGVLLLVVLSMLTLFLMLGTAYLVVSTRSRETARAFAKLSMQSDSTRIPHAQLLDNAFLRLIRGVSGTSATYSTRTSGSIPLLNLTLNSGTVANTATTPTLATTFESLLADKYGSNATGTVSQVTQLPNSQILVAQGVVIPGVDVTAGSATANRPAGLQSTYDFAGRIITLLGPGREPTSHRVLRAALANGGLNLWLDNPSRGRPFISTGSTPTAIVVNGPEFTIHESLGATTRNEAWDGFDAENPFLSHIAPSSTSVASSQVNKIAFIPPGTSTTNLSASDASGFPFGADNDGDGVLDGYFFDIGLPTFFMPNGDEIRIDVSAVVVDLDSRFNVNAHGSLALNTYSTGSNNFHDGWARGTLASGSVPSFVNMPLGSGYGPPEVNASWMFPASNYTPSSLNRTNIFGSNPTAGENPDMAAFAGLQQASQIGRRPTTTRFTSGSNTFRLTNAEGRYGESSTGSLSASDSVANLLTSGNATISGATYGLARPGSPTVDDALSRINDRCVNPSAAGSANGGIPPEWWDATATYDWRAATSSQGLPSPRGIFNSPPDLHGRMITTSATASTSAVPMLAYAKPEWGAREATDDPYELRLDRKASRNVALAATGTTNDNIFSIADLEPVLRPYDRDALQLPPRLSALLGSVAEEARLRITTDSWDTTAVTGSAASTIRTWVKNAIDGGSFPNYAGGDALTGLLGGELSRGERFNLNRPFTATKPASYSATAPYYQQRQAYFKDLFTLLVALGQAPNATTAQWAANVVEFRDADSTMTPFEFDTNPANGWDVDNDATTNDGSSRGLVWGAERPEALIAATSAWENSSTGELFLLLHRPWNALAYHRSTVTGTSVSVPGEPIDAALDALDSGEPQNHLSLFRKSAGTNSDFDDADLYPIWRLRVVDAGGNTSYVRFDIRNSLAAANELVLNDADPTPATAPKMGPDSWLCVMGGNSIPMVVSTGTTTTSGTAAMTSAFRVPGPLPTSGVTTPATRPATVYLERLSDPSATVTPAIWAQNPATAETIPMYRIVDRATIDVVNREQPTPPVVPPAPPTVTQRPLPALWSWPTAMVTSTATSTISAADFSRAANGAMWSPWPNRPFVSSTELLLVPGNDSLGMLQSYVQPSTPTNLPALSANAIPNGLFDAVHVPTRFSGIHSTVSAPNGMAALAAAGVYSDVLSVNQLSSFREPGRVNLNTVTSDDVWNAVVAGPLHTSGSASPVRTRTQANFTSGTATGMHNILSLSATIPLAQSGTSPPIQDTHQLLSPADPLNPVHHIFTATRLANTATVRSNVFGIWITVRESVANDPDSIKLHKAFYIFDRSIPVAFEPGKDHNVWDAVLLRRIVQ